MNKKKKKNCWTSGGSFSYNSISGEAFSSPSNECNLNDNYDLGIFFSSYESRSLFASKHLKYNSCKNSAIIFFTEASSSLLRKRNDSIMTDQVKKCTLETPISITNVSISKLKSSLLNILNSIPQIAYNSDAHWFIDLGGAPTPYFLGLLGFLKNLSLPPSVTFFNPTANYNIDSNTDQVFRFTSGFDRNIFIPNFWGIRDEALVRKYIFMLGHDEYRSYKIYEQQEPDEIEVFITSPGYKDDYEKIAIERNKKFLEECGINDNDINKSCAANVSDTVNKLKKIIEPANKLKISKDFLSINLRL